MGNLVKELVGGGMEESKGHMDSGIQELELEK
ncbi:hypothetical protein T09_6423 [Trichinella sp. T9]|uniref:Uncharacterized protein n=1 Tax=Trichinella pseudospiralis TaxID=6337 RepID=A0A0V1DQQ3_TRIPS|nr:hypothetical protein T09_6423 [Trichinella sp. T9]KRY63895.1 hypothetical protein T4D_5363 [Trichinella pseudospiralis]